MVSSLTVDQEQILLTWNYKDEQAKADFIELLYRIYKPESRTYTGLWQRFAQDISNIIREKICSDPKNFLVATCDG
jgi:hypothetical protein